MKRIIIHDLGPIVKADISLKNVNVIIGEQSIGKSCVLKVACFCTWVEKRIEIEQSAKRFERKDGFMDELLRFHRLVGYEHSNTFIGYESDYIKFSYDRQHGFEYSWKEDRWEYKRPKVSYIPAERNLVAVIPNWYEVKSVAENIQDFMADWSEARKSIDNDREILNLKVSYYYDESNDADYVRTGNGKVLPFANVSSGLQSLIPLYIHLLHITGKKFREKEYNSVKHKQEMKGILDSLVDYYNNNIGEAFVKNPNYGLIGKEEGGDREYIPSLEMTRWTFRGFNNISQTHHCEIFLEEPEQNLFPPTQQLLMRDLLSLTEDIPGNTLFISTHSPYIVDLLLERPEYDFGMFYIQSGESGSIVKTATEQDVQDMYDDGVDAFFNIERLGHEV